MKYPIVESDQKAVEHITQYFESQILRPAITRPETVLAFVTIRMKNGKVLVSITKV